MKKFSQEIFNMQDIKDPFFDSLRADYPTFDNWYSRKASEGEKAFIFRDKGIQAFLYLKYETKESIKLNTGIAPPEPRIKIGTFKLLDTVQGQRLGEGALGIALWYWQSHLVNEIYLTVFEKHQKLIGLIEQFGFLCRGYNSNGERVYFKDKRYIDISTPYKCFPYIKKDFISCGYIPVEDIFHDILFPYSELKNIEQESKEIAAANGITKVFIATPSSQISFDPGSPVLIYRKYNGNGSKMYKSVVTSFCTIVNQINICINKRYACDLQGFLSLVGNKSVYDEQKLKNIYFSGKNIVILIMVYNGYLGAGHNITFKRLKEGGYLTKYPYLMKISQQQFKEIIKIGGKDVQNIIVN